MGATKAAGPEWSAAERYTVLVCRLRLILLGLVHASLQFMARAANKDGTNGRFLPPTTQRRQRQAKIIQDKEAEA